MIVNKNIRFISGGFSFFLVFVFIGYLLLLNRTKNTEHALIGNILSDSVLLIKNDTLEEVDNANLFDNGNLKLINYIFADCGYCLADLYIWDSLFLNNIFPKELDHILILNSRDLISFNHYKNSYKTIYKYIVYDSDEKILRQIPNQDGSNQTLLLDDKNRMIFYGNIIENEKAYNNLQKIIRKNLEE